MIIKTERLVLRPVTAKDAHSIFAYCKDPEIGRNAGWKPHETLEETKKLVDTVFTASDDVFGITLKSEDQVIGTIGLLPDPKRENERSRMVGYSLAREYWGGGIMTEALRALVHYGFYSKNYALISATCYPHNQRSKHVLLKCGFTYEGCLKQAEVLYDGRVEDHECYVLTTGN